MRSSGYIRKIDDLGRIVLPSEIRKRMNISTHDDLNISFDGNCIILKKYKPTCVICHEDGTMISVSDKSICKKCVDMINTL